MKRTALRIVTLLLLAALVGWPPLPAESSSAETGLEALSEVDSSFLGEDLKLGWNKDPFKKIPGYELKDPPQQFVLEAIIGADESDKSAPAMALINGDSYMTGEYVGDHAIVEIGPNYVILEGEEETLTELTFTSDRRSNRQPASQAPQAQTGGQGK